MGGGALSRCTYGEISPISLDHNTAKSDTFGSKLTETATIYLFGVIYGQHGILGFLRGNHAVKFIQFNFAIHVHLAVHCRGIFMLVYRCQTIN